MSNKTLTLTLVIPVYNEQDHLNVCLSAIASQTAMPDEVIVVDNNSSDDTCKIAQSYPFVKLIYEPRQHQTFAQIKGFNAANSDIIGRIDADSILPTSWVDNIKKHFANDGDLVGLTGSTLPYDVFAKNSAVRVFDFYISLASKLAGHRMLWGANCAIRRSSWLKISSSMLQRDDIWEDYDLSFCLSKVGKIQLASDIDVGSSLFRGSQKPFYKQVQYQLRAVRTFYIKAGFIKATVLMMAWLSMLGVYPFLIIDKFITSSTLRLYAQSWRVKRQTEFAAVEPE